VSGKKRERILRSAEREFLLHGFDGTSIDSIVREAGGSKSTVYAHFPDKSILFAEALADIGRDLDFSLPRSESQPARDRSERIELAAIEFLTVMYRERALHLLRIVIAETNRFPEVARRYWEEGPGRAIDRFAELLGDRSRAEQLFSLLLGDHFLRFTLGLDPPPNPDRIVSIAREALATLPGSTARGASGSTDDRNEA
jgi:AcrR family transcriptional regulator